MWSTVHDSEQKKSFVDLYVPFELLQIHLFSLLNVFCLQGSYLAGHPLLQIVLHLPFWRERSTYSGIEIDASVDEDNDKEGLGKNGEEDHDQDDDDAN